MRLVIFELLTKGTARKTSPVAAWTQKVAGTQKKIRFLRTNLWFITL
jgi:hypothetical protein